MKRVLPFIKVAGQDKTCSVDSMSLATALRSEPQQLSLLSANA
jgi:hypothetical protein